MVHLLQASRMSFPNSLSEYANVDLDAALREPLCHIGQRSRTLYDALRVLLCGIYNDAVHPVQRRIRDLGQLGTVKLTDLVPNQRLGKSLSC